MKTQTKHPSEIFPSPVSSLLIWGMGGDREDFEKLSSSFCFRLKSWWKGGVNDTHVKTICSSQKKEKSFCSTHARWSRVFHWRFLNKKQKVAATKSKIVPCLHWGGGGVDTYKKDNNFGSAVFKINFFYGLDSVKKIWTGRKWRISAGRISATLFPFEKQSFFFTGGRGTYSPLFGYFVCSSTYMDLNWYKKKQKEPTNCIFWISRFLYSIILHSISF